MGAGACSIIESDSIVGHVTLPFNITKLSLSNDTPDGTLLYQQQILPSFSQRTQKCETAGQYNFFMYPYNFIPASLDWSGSVIMPDGGYMTIPLGYVYETGVPGVGFAISMLSPSDGGYVFVPPVPIIDCISDSCSLQANYSKASMFFSLIKTGPVSPGIISAANIPIFNVSFGQSFGLFDVYRASFTGSIDVTLPTCITPDYTVNLGKIPTAVFSGRGSASPWVQADINLTNCGSVDQNNKWSISLAPVNGVIDSDNGIMSVDTGASEATGVGIQISSGDVSTADANIVNFALPLEGAFNGSGSFTIPLSARYIQANERVTAGPANGKLIYTISYF